MTREHHNKSVITQFRFKLEPESLQKIDQLQSLTDQPGIVSINTQGDSVTIRYDLMKTGIDLLQQHLINLDLPPVINPWQMLRSALKAFTDQNLRDHEAHQHQCCSKPPVQK